MKLWRTWISGRSEAILSIRAWKAFTSTMPLFNFADYRRRLGPTVNKGIDALIAYVDAKSEGNVDEARKVMAAMTSRTGREVEKTRKLSRFIVSLHQGFEHKDAISAPELTEMLWKYGRPGRKAA
ncbi:MAG: hypothetical protein MdMp014T_1146 [Treponematales bacterium]